MSDTRRKVSLLVEVAVGVLLAVVLLAVALLIAGEHLRPLWLRFIYESDPNGGRPPQEAFDRIRCEHEDIANGVERGLIRCTLEPWPPGNGEVPDLRLSLTNTSSEPVTLWYHTWLHAHVTFIVRDENGKALSCFHWGSLSSLAVGVDAKTRRPTTRVPTRALKPGETYTTGIFLSSLRDYLTVPPGHYRIEAVWVYSDLGGFPAPNQDYVARSQGVEFVVEADDVLNPVWQLHHP